MNSSITTRKRAEQLIACQSQAVSTPGMQHAVGLAMLEIPDYLSFFVEYGMDAARIELKLALDAVGLETLTLQTFSERLNVQKRIYLLQILGYDLGYRFSWYLRGPYCPRLTDDAFRVSEAMSSGDRDPDDFELADSAKNEVERAKNLWSPAEGCGQDDWLELLASLHYLKEIAYWPANSVKDFRTVFSKLIENKPRFQNQKSIAEIAWKRLEDFNLLVTNS